MEKSSKTVGAMRCRWRRHVTATVRISGSACSAARMAMKCRQLRKFPLMTKRVSVQLGNAARAACRACLFRMTTWECPSSVEVTPSRISS